MQEELMYDIWEGTRLQNYWGEELEATEENLALPYVVLWNSKHPNMKRRIVIERYKEYGIEHSMIKYHTRNAYGQRPDRAVYSNSVFEQIDINNTEGYLVGSFYAVMAGGSKWTQEWGTFMDDYESWALRQMKDEKRHKKK